MRQLMGKKKVEKIRKYTGIPVVEVLVRGGTNHRKDLCLEDGTIVHMYSDGSIEKTNMTYERIANDE